MKIRTTVMSLILALAAAAPPAPAQESPTLSFASPEPDAIWFGRLSVRLEVRGLPDEALHTLAVYLDGRLIREFRQPPYSFEQDFGKVPQNSVLKAVLRVNRSVVASAEIRSQAIDDSQEVDVTQVLLPVVVTDSQGNYISDLGQDDFSLMVDNRPQVINRFSRSGKNRLRLALLIDVSSSMKDRIGEVKEAAREFLSELLTPNDKAIVLFFNHEVFEQTDFSGDINELSNAIATAFPFGATALYDAVGYSLQLFRGLTGLNFIIIFSDGEDNSSYLDPYTLIKKAENSNAVIYAIGKQHATFSNEYQTILKNLSTSSGGMLFFVRDTAQIQKVYTQIRHDIKAEYVLEFAPDLPNRGRRYRQISVQIKGKKRYVVRTIKGFYY